MKQGGFALAFILLAITVTDVSTSASDLGTAPVIATYQYWSVRRVTDPMTDAVSCIALYKNRFDLQVSDREMFITEAGRGGVDSIKIRFDNQPPKDLQLATDVEKHIGAVAIRGDEFQELLTARRLRYQIMRLIGSLDSDDVDLSGLAAAHQAIMSTRCGHPSTQEIPSSSSSSSYTGMGADYMSNPHSSEK
jgi:hypothetical protein